MQFAKIRVLHVARIPGRKDLLVSFEFTKGSTADLEKSAIFRATSPEATWRLTNLAQVDPPQSNGDAAGFVRMTGSGTLCAGMELEQVECASPTIHIHKYLEKMSPQTEPPAAADAADFNR